LEVRVLQDQPSFDQISQHHQKGCVTSAGRLLGPQIDG
jgi:hypothetical protein